MNQESTFANENSLLRYVYFPDDYTFFLKHSSNIQNRIWNIDNLRQIET